METVAEKIKQQFDSMIEKGIMAIIEYEVIDHNKDESEFITIKITYSEIGLIFSFDDLGYETWFSGDIESNGHNYLLPFDECFENLDHYLEQINLEMTEGFIIPNNLEII